MRFPTFLFLCAVAPAFANLLEGLPGEEITMSPEAINALRTPSAIASDSSHGVNWLAPSIEEQLGRDGSLSTLGKGAIFVPTYSEPRREPDVAVFDRNGKLASTGQTGQRILLDSGEYDVRFGSGVSGHRLHTRVKVEEGHTTVLPPSWGGLLVETLTDSGGYIDGQYDLIRIENWTSYGRGSGFKEERLQNIKVWILPPGLYRLSKTGEGYNSLRNYITVQINPGELHSVELIFDQASGGNLIAGGTKSLNTHTQVGRHWTFGLRAGGNVGLTRTVDQANSRTQSILVSSDLRSRARYDQTRYFGITELFLQNSFLKDENKPLSIASDYVQLRSTWVRRLNAWLGPYVRGQATTHLFPSHINLDTAYRLSSHDSAGVVKIDSTLITSGSFRTQPSIFPLSLAQGVGVNVEWFSLYTLQLSTQAGFAARQQISAGDYLARTRNSFERAQSSSTIGAEGILTGTLRLSTQFTLDLRMEVFSENASPQALQLENLEADLRFFLTRNVEVGYLFQMSETLDKVVNRFPTTHNLSLRLSFNY